MQAATLPKIELFDNVIFEDASGVTQIGSAEDYAEAQAEPAVAKLPAEEE